MGMKDGRPCIPSRELTWNGMYLNKRTNSTEELQLKQDQDLKEEQEKTRFISKNEMGTNNNKKRNETKIEILKAKKGNVADLLICLF